MKRFIGFSLVALVLICCLASCNFTQSLSGDMVKESEAAPKVEEMLTALAENRISDAKGLMHSQKAENADAALTQMSEYLEGRKADSIVVTGINVNTSTGASGKTRQETVSYQVTLADGDVIYLSVVYLSDNDSTGFISFQLVLGVV